MLGDGASSCSSISDGGNVVAFQSLAKNLAPGAGSNLFEVYVRDSNKLAPELIGVDSSGTPGNGDALGPDVAGDGNLVVFTSQADNLVTGDTNGGADVFLRDRIAGTTTRVSVSGIGVEANLGGSNARISTGGRFVTFTSSATNLVVGPAQSGREVFVRDLQAGTTSWISLTSTGIEQDGDCAETAISNDGQVVAFRTNANNMVAGLPPNQFRDRIYVRDRFTGTTELVSTDSSGSFPNETSSEPSISDDGRFVAFFSRASNLVPSDANGTGGDVFVHDRATRQTMLVGTSATGVQGNGDARDPEISPDGRYVVFRGTSNNLVPGVQGIQVYVKDLWTGAIRVASVDSGGNPTNFFSQAPSISADGTVVAFMSTGVGLVPGPTTVHAQLYTHSLVGCPFPEIYCTASQTSLPGCTMELEFVHSANLGWASDFELSTTAPGGGLAIAIVGVHGQASIPAGTQGGLVCVQPPFLRTPPKVGGGSPQLCNALYEFSLADFVGASPEVVVGNYVHAQVWARDPASADGFALSDALRFVVCP